MNKLLPLPFDHSFKTAPQITKNTRSQYIPNIACEYIYLVCMNISDLVFFVM